MPSKGGARHMRILVAGATGVIGRALMPLLLQAGYDVVAGHREEAMTMVSHDRPDLIALDLLLPKMSGLDVLKGLRQSAGTASIPVIVLNRCMLLGEAREL